MKIKKKVIEESLYEKRTTSILTFASVAVVPLLLSFILGANLGKVKDVNSQNMLDRIQNLEGEIDSLQSVVKESKDQATTLYSSFQQIDSVVEVYKEEVFEALEDQLSNARGELDIHRWENDMRENFDDFEHKIADQTRRLGFGENPELEGVVSFAKKWLDTYARAKSTEFFATKMPQKHALGQSLDADLQTRIDQLQQDLTNCQDQRSANTQEMTRVQIELARAQDKLGEGEQKIVSTSSTKKAEIADLTRKLEACEVNGSTAKGLISNQVQNIEKELLNLEGQRFFQLKNNQRNVDQLKGRIQIILNQIRTSVQEL